MRNFCKSCHVRILWLKVLGHLYLILMTMTRMTRVGFKMFRTVFSKSVVFVFFASMHYIGCEIVESFFLFEQFVVSKLVYYIVQGCPTLLDLRPAFPVGNLPIYTSLASIPKNAACTNLTKHFLVTQSINIIVNNDNVLLSNTHTAFLRCFERPFQSL